MSEKSQNQKPWWQPGLEFFAAIAGWIVFPIVGALFLGRWLDDKYNSEPKWYFICVGVAFVITIVGLVFQSIAALKKMNQIDQEKKLELEEKNK